jgi:integrase
VNLESVDETRRTERCASRHGDTEMSYKLHDNVSFCRVDDHLVFLDTRKDRYFRLSSAMERAFLAYTEGNSDPEVDLGILIERDILTAAPGTATRVPALTVECPVRSAVEQASRAKQIRIVILLDVLAIVCSIRLQLAARNLDSILTTLAAYRRDRTPQPSRILTEPEVERLLDAAARFWHARVYVPIEPRCLLDSLAMVKFLAKRGLYANIIFGVTSDPFAAHAWVQAGDLVLSDTVGHAAAHTPIRVE